MHDTKRFLFVDPHSGIWGASLSMLALVKHMVAEGHKVIVLLRDDQGIVSHLEELGVDVEYYNFKSWCATNQKYKPWHIFRSIPDVIKSRKHAEYLSKKYGTIDCVYTNTIVTYYGLLLSSILGAKHIHHIRENAIKDFNMSFAFGYKRTMKIIDWLSERIICVSKDVENEILKQVKHAKTTVIYNGVSDLDIPIREKKVVSDELKLVFIGRLSNEKGVQFAVENVLKAHRNGIPVTLDIYGSGELYDEICNIIKDNGASHYISLKGYVSDVPLDQYDLGLMCSKNEAFGRTTVEYMLSGLPVIGVDSGGTKEIIVNGKTGLFYGYGNSKSFLDCISKFYQRQDLIQKYGTEGRKRALSNFSVERYVSEVEEILVR